MFLVLIVGLVVGRSPKFILNILLMLCFISTLARIAIVAYGDLDAAFRQTQYRIDSLLYGVILALLYHFYPDKFTSIAKQKRVLQFVIIILIIWIYFTADNYYIVRTIGYTIHGVGFALLLVLIYAHSGLIRDQFWYRAISWTGIYSYGIYLWHTLALEPGRRIIGVMESLDSPVILTWVVAVGAQFGAGIFVGFLMTKLVEWPFLHLREKLFPAAHKEMETIINVTVLK